MRKYMFNNKNDNNFLRRELNKKREKSKLTWQEKFKRGERLPKEMLTPVLDTEYQENSENLPNFKANDFDINALSCYTGRQ